MSDALRFLFTVWDGGGTVPPVLGLGRRLVERGHRVMLLGDPTIADEARGAGLEHTPWTTAPHRTSRRPEDDLIRDYEIKNPMTMIHRYVESFIGKPAAQWAGETLAALESWKADMLVADMSIPAALIAGEKLGLFRQQRLSQHLDAADAGNSAAWPRFSTRARTFRSGARRDPACPLASSVLPGNPLPQRRARILGPGARHEPLRASDASRRGLHPHEPALRLHVASDAFARALRRGDARRSRLVRSMAVAVVHERRAATRSRRPFLDLPKATRDASRHRRSTLPHAKRARARHRRADDSRRRRRATWRASGQCARCSLGASCTSAP